MAHSTFFGVHKWTVNPAHARNDHSQIGNKSQVGIDSRIGLAPAGFVTRARFGGSAKHGINIRLCGYATKQRYEYGI